MFALTYICICFSLYSFVFSYFMKPHSVHIFWHSAIKKASLHSVTFFLHSWIFQSWKDEFLVWDSQDFDGVKKISIPTANVWVPDILINEL